MVQAIEKTIKNSLHSFYKHKVQHKEQHKVQHKEQQSVLHSKHQKKILAAVSGGADSIALLIGLHSIQKDLNFDLFVLTVNHNMRPPAESSQDALFVSNLCASLTPPVSCTIIELAQGEVAQLAQTRKKGEEDAARFLRHAALKKEARRLKADCVCTGHTQNDQLETILMRFLQGGGSQSLSGIKKYRKPFLRPLLEISRVKIEAYLQEKGYSWREDSTNVNPKYLRNKIRLSLVPFLDKEFKGWNTALLKSAEKSTREYSCIQESLDHAKGMSDSHAFSWFTSTSETSVIHCNSAFFNSLHPAQRLLFLHEGLSLLACKERIPYSFLAKIADTSGKRRFSASKLDFIDDDTFISFKHDIEQWSKSGYLVYITQAGGYDLPCGWLEIEEQAHGIGIGDLVLQTDLPICIRSRTGGDVIKQKGRSLKKLNEFYSTCSISEEHRDLLPLIEKDGTILALYGSILGYKNILF